MSEPVTGAIEQPYYVVDHLLSAYIDTYFHNTRWQREPITSGSCEYRLYHADGGRLFLTAYVSAAGADRTILTLQSAVEMQLLQTILALLARYVDRAIQDAKKLPLAQTLISDETYRALTAEQESQLAVKIAASVPPSKRPGPAPKPYTLWAREQKRLGRPLDDPSFLDEYMQLRDEDPSDEDRRRVAYDTLRRTVRRQ